LRLFGKPFLDTSHFWKKKVHQIGEICGVQTKLYFPNHSTDAVTLQTPAKISKQQNGVKGSAKTSSAHSKNATVVSSSNGTGNASNTTNQSVKSNESTKNIKLNTTSSGKNEHVEQKANSHSVVTESPLALFAVPSIVLIIPPTIISNGQQVAKSQ
jgi:hypothetical protein